MYGGFTRIMDEIGRIVIPKQIRKELGIDKPGSVIEMFCDGKQLILKKAATHCTFCKSESDLVEFEGKHICKGCLDKLKAE